MSRPLNIRITKTYHNDYDMYLMGQVRIIDLMEKRNLSESRIKKIFDILYKEKRIQSAIENHDNKINTNQ